MVSTRVSLFPRVRYFLFLDNVLLIDLLLMAGAMVVWKYLVSKLF